MAAFLEAQLATNFQTSNGPNYALTQAILALIVFVAVIIFTAVGREAKGIEFSRERDPALEEGQPATDEKYSA